MAASVAAGSAIWELSDDLDLLLTREQLARLCDFQRGFGESYGFPHMTHRS